MQRVAAPILYMEGACGVRLKADDSIADIFKNGRAVCFSWLHWYP
ncbi:hypothetical protein O9929_25240 [Vibrio lentus]|nr:hypothetical protein [Vibrio lentus]